MEGGRTIHHGHRPPNTGIFGKNFLKFAHILADRRYPAGVQAIFHINPFIA
jgi:hypothetical protein